MREDWHVIEEFPDYIINSYGEIVNDNTGRTMSTSLTKEGNVKVGLSKDGEQFTRSLTVLVAEIFVPGRTETFDTPIHLDGNQQNNDAMNLMWRPRWFAYKYKKQFREVPNQNHAGPIIDLQTSEVYDTALDVAMRNGLIVRDLLIGMVSKSAVFPTWQVFSFLDD